MEASHWLRACTATTSWKVLPLLLLKDYLRCFNSLLETVIENKIVKKWGKTQSCSKLPDMASKSIKNVFLNFWPHFLSDLLKRVAVAHAPPEHRGTIRLHRATPLWSLLQWLPSATNANLFLLWLPREPTARENTKGKNVGQSFQKTFGPWSLWV